MRRIASAASLFVFAVLGSIFLLPRAAACPPPPVPLRLMFLRSDLVIVGKFSTMPNWIAGPQGTGGDIYNGHEFHRTLQVNVEETLWGAAPKDLALAESTVLYLEKDQEKDRDLRTGLEFGELPGVVTPPNFLVYKQRRVERRLFFLKRDAGSGEYREMGFTFPFLPDQDELSKYIPAFRELRRIYTQPAASPQAVTEWLVTLAEDPVTRREGAYDLTVGHITDWTRPAESPDQPPVEMPPAASSEGSDNPFSKLEVIIQLQRPPSVRGDEGFYRLMSSEQKERLIRTFLNISFNHKEIELSEADKASEYYTGPVYEPILTSADQPLLDIVGGFHDIRVTAKLIAETPLASKYDPYRAGLIMKIVGGYYGDEKLKELGNLYLGVYYGAEDEVIASQIVFDGQTGGIILAPPTRASFEPMTRGQRRAELLQQFMDRCARLSLKTKRQ